MPCFWSRNAKEKTPEESFPLASGVSALCQTANVSCPEHSRLAGPQPDPSFVGRHGAVAGGESRLSRERLQAAHRPPCIPAVLCLVQAHYRRSTSSTRHWITVEEAVLPVSEENPIPKTAGSLRIDEQQLPAVYSRRLSGTGEIDCRARSTSATPFVHPRPRYRGSPVWLHPAE